MTGAGDGAQVRHGRDYIAAHYGGTVTRPLPGTASTEPVDLAALIAGQDDETALVALGILESRWRTLHSCRDADCWGYEPYPQDMFTRLIEPAIKAAGKDRPLFLDAGAGIGAKGLYAERLGCEAFGIEHNPHLVAEAARIGANVTEGDVRNCDWYAYDIVWANCPFRDPVKEAAFEAEAAEAMRPGAVLILGNKCGPDPQGWKRLTTVIERDGAWQKPTA